MSGIKVLLAGESWESISIHIKGFDFFTSSSYEEGGRWLISGLQKFGVEVDFLPNHLAAQKFPTSSEELKTYQVVILSDIGSNTLLLHPDTFIRSKRTPNRLQLLRTFVEEGGGFIMVGGYMSYQGIEGKARYKDTPIEEILPVTMFPGDDRMEVPEGFVPEIVKPNHPILKQIPSQWPFMLFCNKTKLKPDGTLILKHNEFPILAVRDYGEGRTMTFTPDCGPAGAPPEFLNWEYYGRFWYQSISWLTKKSPASKG
ncbi:MAG: cytoplasmic protein [Candidatus Aerophobus sp.]|nr:MAG: cytoplasmic protein [Candidatus Aerophobus sp.]